MKILVIVTIMTKETSTPDSLETQIAEAPANLTVFSDGSTFDYENGYKSNGAPVATRDRTENPTIVKSHQIVTFSGVMEFLMWLLACVLIAAAVSMGVTFYQSADNNNALKAGINSSGKVEVVQSSEVSALVKRPNGDLFKCDVSMISNNGSPEALLFCAPGGPATFSVPLPHDPNNIFYVAPAKDSKK